MNIIFPMVALASIFLLCLVSPEAVTGIMLDGSLNAIQLTLKMLAIYAVWMSVLKMIEATKFDKKLNKLLNPITGRLFKNESEEAKGYININLTSNILGLGGAATPAGIKAINAMYKGEEKASKNMVMLMVVNATSLQLLPTTVISLLSAHGSSAPSAVILPIIASTVVSAVCGVILVSVFVKR